MHIGARAHSVDDVAFLAEAGYGFAEIDWKDPALLHTQQAELASLARGGLTDGGAPGTAFLVSAVRASAARTAHLKSRQRNVTVGPSRPCPAPD